MIEPTMTDIDNYYSHFLSSKVKDKKKLQQSELYNLLKRPPKEKPNEQAHYNFAYNPNYHHQMDLLYMPHDEGYKYAVVVTDLATRLSDAEPIKEKSSIAVLAAMKKIYNRKILSIPEYITMDSGSEFKGDVKKFFENNKVFIKYGKPSKHQMLSVVESTNKTLACMLFSRMTAEEILTGETSRSWVEDLPKAIAALNKHRKVKPKKPKGKVPICSGDDCELLELKTKVCVKLFDPVDYVEEWKLHGRFRATDIRWAPEKRTIESYLLLPNQPPMYFLNDSKKSNNVDTTAAYTKKQLQIIHPDEKAPPISTIRGKPTQYVIQEIVDRKKEKGKIWVRIHWKGWDDPKDFSWEKRSEVIKTAPEKVAEFERSNK